MINSHSSLNGKIFIGHGRSNAWEKLRDFIRYKLKLDWMEFNRDPVAGHSTKERLEEMLNQCSFAFLIMTGEEEQTDGTKRARQNVVHEIGLFQGRLGFKRAIILLEEGCSEFSNIVGLTQIRFPTGNIMAQSEEIREVLGRELSRSLSRAVSDEIRFDYLPDLPTQHGWTPGYAGREEPEAEAYTAVSSAPVPGSIAINTSKHYALDYHLGHVVCDGLQFEAKYTATTMIFTEITLRSRDGSHFTKKWIKYNLGNAAGNVGIRAEVTKGYEYEYTIWWPATALSNGWVSLDISLSEAVEHTWGKTGFSYESLETFRIRGSLSISPIRWTLNPELNHRQII